MKKYIGIIALMLIALVVLIATMASSDSETKFFVKLRASSYKPISNYSLASQNHYHSASISSSSNTTQFLPHAYLRGENLTYWYNTSWSTYYNYTSVQYKVNIWKANFTGTIGKWDVSGKFSLAVDAYGNNSYISPYGSSQIWEYGVGVTIEVYNSWISSMTFDRELAIYPSDLRNFLRAWVNFTAVPYLLNNSSNTTGIQFPEYNITGWELQYWLSQDYSNYTIYNYYVYVYNFTPYLYQDGNDVYGAVNLSFIAFGNDTAYCPGYYCNQTTVYSNATIYVNGVQPNDPLPGIYVNYYLRVNYSDIQNFLRGYYYAVMVPNITTYYNITTNTTNHTIYLPNYYNDSQIFVDCSQYPWSYYYCSGASPQSYLLFSRAIGKNLSITVNDRGDGYFNGILDLPYVANLINFTSTYYGKETLIDNLQGNASLSLFGWVNGTGNDTYYVTLSDYAYANVIFDRNSFVQNATQQLYSDRFMWYIQWFVNSVLSNDRRRQY